MRMHERDAVALIAGNENVTNNYVIGYVFPTDEPMSNDDIMSWFVERCDTMPHLRDRVIRVPLDLTLPVYSPDPNFSYARHIEFLNISSWDELRTRVPAMVQEEMDPARPRWKIYVAPHVDGVLNVDTPATVVLLKFHHSLGDGGESIDIARALFSEKVPPRSSRAAAVRAPRRGALVGGALWQAPVSLASFVWSLRHVVSGRKAFARDVESGAVTIQKFDRSSVPFVGRLGRSRQLECVTLSVADMKAVKNAVGDVTINDILLATISLGLSKYLDEKGISVPHSLGTSMPISTRTLDPDATARNQFVTSMVNLHTDEPDPIERVRRIHSSARASIALSTNASNRLIGKTLGGIPGSFLRVIYPLMARLQKPGGEYPIHTSVSSLIMGRDGWKLGESSASASFGVMSLEALVGLAHLVNTIADTATINMVSDPDLFSDLARYRELVELGWRELEEHALAAV